MKEKIKEIFLNKFSLKEYKIILVTSLLIKLFYFAYFAYLHNLNQPVTKVNYIFHIDSKDYLDYIRPIEGLLDNGEYSYVVEGKKVLAFRMPGFLPIYGPLYAISNREITSLLIVLLNFIADYLTVIIITAISLIAFKNRVFALITLALYNLSIFISVNNHYVITETISTFFFSLSILLTLLYVQNEKGKYLFWAGFFLTWSSFLRPANFSILILIPVVILFYFFKRGKSIVISKNVLLKKLILPVFLFLSSFIVTEAIWVKRNFNQFHRFVPLQTYKDDYPKELLSLFDFIITIGDDIQGWVPDSWVSWFLPPTDPNYNKEFSESAPFDRQIYTSKYNLDTLKQYRHLYGQIILEKDSLKKQLLITEFCNKTKVYINSYKEEAPLYYKIYTKFKLTYKYLFIKQLYQSPFIRTNLFNKLNKAFFLGIYYIIIISFIISSFLIALQLKSNQFIENNIFVIIILVITWSHLLLHSVLLGYIENRYLANIFPLMCVIGAFSLVKIFPKNWYNALDS